MIYRVNCNCSYIDTLFVVKDCATRDEAEAQIQVCEDAVFLVPDGYQFWIEELTEEEYDKVREREDILEKMRKDPHVNILDHDMNLLLLGLDYQLGEKSLAFDCTPRNQTKDASISIISYDDKWGKYEIQLNVISFDFKKSAIQIVVYISNLQARKYVEIFDKEEDLKKFLHSKSSHDACKKAVQELAADILDVC